MENVERLAKIEATLDATAKSLDRITGFLERNVVERTAQHTETVKTLAVLGEKQDSTKAEMLRYQTECTLERDDMKDDINELDRQRALQTGKTAGIAAAISMVIATVGLLLGFLRSGGLH